MQQSWQNRQITLGRLVRFIVVSAIILFIVIAASIWMMSAGNVMPTSWSGFIAVLFATLTVLFAFFQLVFPPVPKSQQLMPSSTNSNQLAATTTPSITDASSPNIRSISMLHHSDIVIFQHRTSKEDTKRNFTVLQLHDTSEKALLFATLNWDNNFQTYSIHPIGVGYNPNLKKWTIFNQDKASMEEGITFNVMYVPPECILIEWMYGHG